ncbi:transmembrane protein 62-like [Glandiceps talaboti]
METPPCDDYKPHSSNMRRKCGVLLFFIVVGLICALCSFTYSWHYFTVVEDNIEKSSHPLDEQPPYPGPTSDNLWWFVQISDVHLNEFYDKERYHQFWHFCSSYVDIIQPTLVLVTGDITDAVHRQKAHQSEIEWEMYKKCLEDSGVLKKTTWIDIKGNHDTYNIPSADSKQNLYRQFSQIGKQGESNFVHHQKTSFGTYSFIYIDAVTPLPSLKPPFNFFGILSKTNIKDLLDLTNQTKSSNSTVFFTHYPSSFIVDRKPGISTVLSNGIATLSGHLHDIYGRVPDMKITQKSGTLELELLDWKDNREYRVLAFDHDLLSIVDSKYGQWPVILITNPKNARFLSPKHEPTRRMRQSTHIRFLVFSPINIKSAKVSINDEFLGEASHVSGPLYVLKWNPLLYVAGLHKITVQTQDLMGHESQTSQTFSLDGSRPQQNIISAFLLMTDMTQVLKVCFIIGNVLTLVPLLLLRFFTRPSSTYFLWIPFAKIPLLRGLLLLVHINVLYYIVMTISCWAFIGPWFFGEMVDGYFGFACLYGVYVNGTLYADSMIYREALHDMLYFLVPFIFHLALQIELMFPMYNQTSLIKCQHRHIDRVSWWIKFLTSQYLFISALRWQVHYSWYIWSAYGALSFLLCPKYTWTTVIMLLVFLSIYFVYFSKRKQTSSSTRI